LLARLDHGDALTIDGDNQNGGGLLPRLGEARGVESIVGERAAWQLHGFIEGMDAASPFSTITDAVDVDETKDCLQGPALETAVVVEERGGLFCDPQGRADITVAALLDVNLEEQTLQVTTLVLLLALDLMQWEL
jgi:hypothetical protein